ncbi:hypothetical protein GY26_15995 [Gammaproteobacteria bacterium MFB021]|nr:hypothetical protein GY26_15995 [Gammaproteobacteria bacterium MFB021]
MTNAPNRKLAARISTFTTSLALAVGGLTSSPDVMALHKELAEKAPAVAKSVAEMRREAYLSEALASCNSLLGSLNEAVELMDQIAASGMDEESAQALDLPTNELNLESIRQIERKFDQLLTEMRMVGYSIPPDLQKIRKLVALARFKTVHLVTTVRHLQGVYTTFEGSADPEGLRQVAMVSTESLHDRLH